MTLWIKSLITLNLLIITAIVVLLPSAKPFFFHLFNNPVNMLEKRRSSRQKACDHLANASIVGRALGSTFYNFCHLQSTVRRVPHQQSGRWRVRGMRNVSVADTELFSVTRTWRPFHFAFYPKKVYGQVAVTYRFPSYHRSQAPSSGVSTWMGDHPGTPRAGGNTWCTRLGGSGQRKKVFFVHYPLTRHMAKPRPQVGRVC